MQLGRVVGHAVSTIKHASFQGWRLLVVQALTPDGKPDGEPLLAIDSLGAGAGEIVIVNSDPILHNTHGYYGRLTAFNVGLPKQGLRIPKPLTRPGLVKVDCDAHGWMLGWVYVADNPYYAVTSRDGAFTIKNVPPGSYTLVAWQEFTGPIEVPVTVKPAAVQAVNVDLAKK